MDAIIQYFLTLPPLVTLTIFFMVWTTITAAFMTMGMTPLLLHEDVFCGKVSIFDAYLWVVDETVQEKPRESQRCLVDDRLTVVTNEPIINHSAIQVNPKCVDHGKFIRACWNVYGTGRTEPDPLRTT